MHYRFHAEMPSLAGFRVGDFSSAEYTAPALLINGTMAG